MRHEYQDYICKVFLIVKEYNEFLNFFYFTIR